MNMNACLDLYRILFCGSRTYRRLTVALAAVNSFYQHYGDRLVVIEGACTGADKMIHDWCVARGFGPDRHRCHPVDWELARATRPDWKRAGNERNTVMLAERPHQVIALHDEFNVAYGGTSDMCLKALLKGIPVWIINGPTVHSGYVPTLEDFPLRRMRQTRSELVTAGLLAS